MKAGEREQCFLKNLMAVNYFLHFLCNIIRVRLPSITTCSSPLQADRKPLANEDDASTYIYLRFKSLTMLFEVLIFKEIQSKN